MKAVIQRVTSASVTVDRKEVSKIGRGFCVLVGIGVDDSKKEVDYLVSKILSLRLFPSLQSEPASSLVASSSPELKQWSQNIRDIMGELLIVSQFTLMAKTKKGNKPDFHNAMKSEQSKQIYQDLIDSFKLNYQQDLIKQGEFGAMMEVNISNEGPVTIILDTNDR